jgi:hypothetical protein
VRFSDAEKCVSVRRGRRWGVASPTQPSAANHNRDWFTKAQAQCVVGGPTGVKFELGSQVAITSGWPGDPRIVVQHESGICPCHAAKDGCGHVQLGSGLTTVVSVLLVADAGGIPKLVEDASA